MARRHRVEARPHFQRSKLPYNNSSRVCTPTKALNFKRSRGNAPNQNSFFRPKADILRRAIFSRDKKMKWATSRSQFFAILFFILLFLLSVPRQKEAQCIVLHSGCAVLRVFWLYNYCTGRSKINGGRSLMGLRGEQICQPDSITTAQHSIN
jgi:hypothetical protein